MLGTITPYQAGRAAEPGEVGGTAEQVLRTIRQRPGLNVEELAQALAIGRTAVNHHVRRLHRRGLVTSLTRGRHRIHFSTADNSLRRSIGLLLRTGATRMVCEVLAGQGVVHLKDLLTAYDERTLRRARRRLEESGMGIEFSRGRSMPLSPAVWKELQHMLLSVAAKDVAEPRLRVIVTGSPVPAQAYPGGANRGATGL